MPRRSTTAAVVSPASTAIPPAPPKAAKPKKRNGKTTTAKPLAVAAETRVPIYLKVETKVYHGDTAMTAADAKDFLGWEEEGDSKFGEEYTFRHPVTGEKIRCANNLTNRPVYSSVVATLQQEHTRRRWRLNGEAIIVGTHGAILNGQHTLISLVLADEEWRANKDLQDKYSTPPTMEKVVVFGITEDDEVVNTMDTCKPRSLADVLYRSAYYSKLTRKDRKMLSRITDYAIRLLWHRTGADAQAFGLRRTHAEAIEFLSRHPKIVDCANHIHQEDSEGRIGRLISPGYAAGLMYLMATGASSEMAYVENPTEESLDFSQWEKACEYYVMIGSGSPGTKDLKSYITSLLAGGDISQQERWAIITKGWTSYLNSGAVKRKDIELAYVTDDEGLRSLDEDPTCGGIDLGEIGRLTRTTEDPSKEEITQRAAEVRSKKTPAPAQVAKRAGEDWSTADTAWICAAGEEPYYATLASEPYDCSDGKRRVMVSAADGDWEVEVDNLQLQAK